MKFLFLFVFYYTLLKVWFICFLMLFGVKAFTTHYCLAGRIYWQFKYNKAKVNNHDTVYTVNAGPISLLVVR